MPKGESLWPLFGEAFFIFHIFFFFVGFLATKITGCYLKSWDMLGFFLLFIPRLSIFLCLCVEFRIRFRDTLR